MTKPSETFGSRLRRVRIQRNVTQTQLAKEAGVSSQRINQIEHGEGELSAGPLFKAAAFLVVSPHWLTTGEGDPDPGPESIFRLLPDGAKILEALMWLRPDELQGILDMAKRNRETAKFFADRPKASNSPDTK